MTREELEDEAKTQQEAVDSVRETLLGRVNLNGYYNFRFSADDSPTPIAFQQHHLGVLMGKQLGRFNFLMELELQNVPHHPEISRGIGGIERARRIRMARPEENPASTSAVKARWPLKTPGWNTITIVTSTFASGNSSRPSTGGRTTTPNLTYSTTLPIYLRELFPAELVGAMAHGTVARPMGASEIGIGYKVYVANNQFEGNSQCGLDGREVVGRPAAVAVPDGRIVQAF